MNILIVDDHQIVRDGIVALLNGNSRVHELITAENGFEALDKLKKHSIDLVILDVNMPKMNGIECTIEIKKHFQTVKILILTMLNEEQHIRKMIEAGANGYILKNSGKKELFEAVETLKNGRYYFSDDVTSVIMNDLISPKPKRTNKLEDNFPLTERELEVITLIVKEFTNPEIAEKLHISVRTVDAHRRNLLEKTGARNTAGLVTYAIAHHLVEFP